MAKSLIKILLFAYFCFDLSAMNFSVNCRMLSSENGKQNFMAEVKDPYSRFNVCEIRFLIEGKIVKTSDGRDYVLTFGITGDGRGNSSIENLFEVLGQSCSTQDIKAEITLISKKNGSESTETKVFDLSTQQ